MQLTSQAGRVGSSLQREHPETLSSEDLSSGRCGRGVAYKEQRPAAASPHPEQPGQPGAVTPTGSDQDGADGGDTRPFARTAPPVCVTSGGWANSGSGVAGRVGERKRANALRCGSQGPASGMQPSDGSSRRAAAASRSARSASRARRSWWSPTRPQVSAAGVLEPRSPGRPHAVLHPLRALADSAGAWRAIVTQPPERFFLPVLTAKG